MKNIIICFFLLFSGLLTFAQGSKEIKLNKIKSVTTWQSDTEEGSAELVKESYDEFDKNGNPVLEINYKKDGTVNHKKTTKYDRKQNKIEEIEYEGDFVIKSHKAYMYNSLGKKTDEREYNPSGALIQTTSFSYYPDGEKKSETTTDAKGTVLKLVEYKYNSRQLKIQKISQNKEKKSEAIKKWSYEYH
jgi:hypothetical protein